MVSFIKINATFFSIFYVHWNFPHATTTNNFKFLCYDFKCLLLFLECQKQVFRWMFSHGMAVCHTDTHFHFFSVKKCPDHHLYKFGHYECTVGHQSNPHSSSHFALNFFIIILRAENFESIGYSNPLLSLMLNWGE